MSEDKGQNDKASPQPAAQVTATVATSSIQTETVDFFKQYETDYGTFETKANTKYVINNSKDLEKKSK